MKSIHNKKKSSIKLTSLIRLVTVCAWLLMLYAATRAVPTTISSVDGINNKYITNTKNTIYTSCLEETLRNLPIGKGPPHKRKKKNQLLVWAHHFDARNPKWNDEIRFHPIPALQQQQQKCSIWEVGAHTEAADSREFIRQYPQCEYHAYEPIPHFFKQLSNNWEGISNMNTHQYGIGGARMEFNVSSELLKGQSTFIGEKNQADDNDVTTVIIQSFDFAVKDAGGSKPTLLHMNCEGCEWDLLPAALEKGFLQDIPVIQVGFHNYGSVGLGERAIEYCQIRTKLSRTHQLVPGAIPFAWERWVRL